VRVAALLGLLAAIGYGAADFVGGLGGRRTRPGVVAVLSQACGLVAASIAVLVVPGVGPTAPVLLWGALGGVGSGIGNASLYRGLARGRMGVVAPLSAIATAAIPALIGILLGERLTALAIIGVVLALPAIALVSGFSPSTFPRAVEVGWGFLAGGGFALLFVALDLAGTASGAWPLVPGQAVAVVVSLAISWADLGRGVPWRPALGAGALAGLLAQAANLLFLAATGAGQLAVVAVLTALYPAVTVVLAAALLRERIDRYQLGGLAIAAVAVTLIVLP
jgi:drug/metabolite transporter (DMT)-like permease